MSSDIPFGLSVLFNKVIKECDGDTVEPGFKVNVWNQNWETPLKSPINYPVLGDALVSDEINDLGLGASLGENMHLQM